MVDTYTDNLGFLKQFAKKLGWAPGEQNDKDLYDEAIAGSVDLDVTTGATLTITDGVSDDGRHATIVFTGTPAISPTISLPNVEKVWNFLNPLAVPAAIKTAGSNTLVLQAGASGVVVCDGADNIKFASKTIRATEPKKKALAFADSPYSVSLLDQDKNLVVDTSGGSVDITLPEISSLAPVAPDRSGWRVTVFLAEATAKVTVSAGGSDNIGAGTSTSRELVELNEVIVFEADEAGFWIVVSGGSGIIGEVKQLASNKIPPLHLAMDGAEVSRTTYALLFDDIGTTYGSGDGSTTFNLPNVNGRMLVGIGQGNTAEGGGLGTDYALGDTGGKEDHTQQTGEVANHNHSVPQGGDRSSGVGYRSGAAQDSRAGQTTGGLSAPTPMPIRNPYLALKFVIYAGA